LQPYTSNYHTYAYQAGRWRTCPYTIIAFSVNGYVSLTGFMSFTPLPTRHIIQSTIETTALKTTYRSMITARRDIDRFIIQLSTLMAAEKSSETNWHTRRVTCDDGNYHDYRPRLFDLANERNRIRSREIEHHSYKSIERDHQSENLQSMTRSCP
jgi:hypothetical protein